MQSPVASWGYLDYKTPLPLHQLPTVIGTQFFRLIFLAGFFFGAEAIHTLQIFVRPGTHYCYVAVWNKAWPNVLHMTIALQESHLIILVLGSIALTILPRSCLVHQTIYIIELHTSGGHLLWYVMSSVCLATNPVIGSRTRSSKCSPRVRMTPGESPRHPRGITRRRASREIAMFWRGKNSILSTTQS